MKLQYPRLNKCVFLWPVLWGITFFRFLHNTYKIRNTTLFQTLRQFKKTNSHTQLIRIFENSFFSYSLLPAFSFFNITFNTFSSSI